MKAARPQDGLFAEASAALGEQTTRPIPAARAVEREQPSAEPAKMVLPACTCSFLPYAHRVPLASPWLQVLHERGGFDRRGWAQFEMGKDGLPRERRA